jgi:hypothetical protein
MPSPALVKMPRACTKAWITRATRTGWAFAGAKFRAVELTAIAADGASSAKSRKAVERLRKALMRGSLLRRSTAAPMAARAALRKKVH